MKQCCLLTCSSWLVQFAFLHSSGLSCPGMMPPPSLSWALPDQSLIKEVPQRLAYRELDGSIFSIESSSQITLACVQFSKFQARTVLNLGFSCLSFCSAVIIGMHGTCLAFLCSLSQKTSFLITQHFVIDVLVVYFEPFVLTFISLSDYSSNNVACKNCICISLQQ